jgi:hypothetical protein
MEESTELPKWIQPEARRIADRTARDRADASKWDLNVAILLFSILAIITILGYEGATIWLMAPVAILGLAAVWAFGWLRGRQAYAHFLEEELAQLPDDWKDYYGILGVSRTAAAETITGAYNRIARPYNGALSEEAKRVPMYEMMMKDADEAFNVLSDPTSREKYDEIYWLRHNVDDSEIDDSVRNELFDLSRSISDEVTKVKDKKMGLPRLNRKTQRIISMAVAVVLVVLIAGTSFAFVSPESALAEPFKGIAISVASVPANAIDLIGQVRGVAAMTERRIVASSVQWMRIEEGVKVVPVVTESTNDMAVFPSPEHPLYPEYLESRYTQFKYTVDSHGSVTVDTSWATTDAFLENIRQRIYRLENDILFGE